MATQLIRTYDYPESALAVVAAIREEYEQADLWISETHEDPSECAYEVLADVERPETVSAMQEVADRTA